MSTQCSISTLAFLGLNLPKIPKTFSSLNRPSLDENCFSFFLLNKFQPDRANLLKQNETWKSRSHAKAINLIVAPHKARNKLFSSILANIGDVAREKSNHLHFKSPIVNTRKPKPNCECFILIIFVCLWWFEKREGKRIIKHLIFSMNTQFCRREKNIRYDLTMKFLKLFTRIQKVCVDE